MEPNTTFAPRIYYLSPLLLGKLGNWLPHLDRAASMGFDHILIAPPFLPGQSDDIFITRDHNVLHPVLVDEGVGTHDGQAGAPGRINGNTDALAWLTSLAQEVNARGMSLLLDVALGSVDREAGLYRDHPDWFKPPGGPERRLDPRGTPHQEYIVYANFADPEATDRLIDWWSWQLRRYAECGIVGFRFDDARGVPPHVWRRLAAGVREIHPLQRFLVWTPGLSRSEIATLEDAGFDATFSSIRWWDYRADWMAEEQAALARVAPSIGFPEAPFGIRLLDDLPDIGDLQNKATLARAYRRALDIAVSTGNGWMLPAGFEFGAHAPFHRDRDGIADFEALLHAPRLDLQQDIRALNRLAHQVPTLNHAGVLTTLTGPDANATALLRCSGSDARYAEHAILIVANPDLHQTTLADTDAFLEGIPAEFTLFAEINRVDGKTDTTKAVSGTPRREGDVESDAPAPLHRFAPLTPFALAPAEIRLFEAHRSVPIATLAPSTKRSNKVAERKAATEAVQVPRIAIEAVSPAVDEGRFPAKRVVGEQVSVEADIFMDGHDKIAAVALWRVRGSEAWQELPMRPLGNDRWSATLPLLRLGAYEYTVEAWRDTFGTLVDHIAKKVAVKQDVTLELAEAKILFGSLLGGKLGAAELQPKPKTAKAAATVKSAKASKVVEGGLKADKADKADKTTKADKLSAKPEKKSAVDANGAIAAAETRDGSADTLPLLASTSALRAIASEFATASADRQLAIVLAPETASAVASTRQRDFSVRHTAVLSILAERAAARFANWYELFPRSQSGDLHRHGTFIDVIARLPAISAMGFDVLYFPPIHPIGLANRKGPNNTLTPGPEDVGSPYAIGAPEGGHTAIHPELGSFDDFRSLMTAARCHGIELALDFAIQCSPDHPWLKEHPQWFAWRPDGTLRYAENPPKKYQDIVNPDFYSNDAVPALWLELRDVILFWIGAGIHIFRVDNPHTKPLPFWEWMIGDIRSRHPEVIFLSEAFTRPKVMNRLAKVGFSQSYTYFTWRETKQEFTDYMTELTQTPAREYFRPNFFVNTPDINPRFLQHSGRAGFVIRAALAATLAGVWGVYSGFELCEAAALPNSEEYLDSEKYQIRTYDWQRLGNIIGEISMLNRIRRANPALHTHLNIAFLPSSNPNVLFFEKSTPNRDNVLLIAIALQPEGIQESSIEIPLWRWGLSDADAVQAEDLVSTEHFTMHGKYQTIRLDPQVMPFAIRRISAPGYNQARAAKALDVLRVQNIKQGAGE